MYYTAHTYLIKSLFLVFALVLATAACDGPVGPPATQLEGRAQSPNGPKGPPFAEATTYVFEGHDWTVSNFASRTISNLEDNADEYSWLVYLKLILAVPETVYQVPGWGFAGNSEYRVLRNIVGEPENDLRLTIGRVSGPGEEYQEIRIVLIKPSDEVVCPEETCAALRASPESLIPADLDTSDYDAVMDYYGLTEEDAVRL